MLSIRLSRVGKTKHAVYRVVVMDKARDPWSRHLEIVAAYDPHRQKENLYNVKTDRIEHWLKCGAQPSGTVHNLFVDAGLVKGEKKRAITISKIRRARMEKKAQAQTKETKEPAALTGEAAASVPEEKVQEKLQVDTA